MEAKFVHGNPTFIRYKRGTAILAGEVITVGALIMIAHNNIAANEEGALSIGPGVYKSIATGILAVGVRCDWDDTAKELVAKDAGDSAIGYINPVVASAAGKEVEFILQQGVIDLII